MSERKHFPTFVSKFLLYGGLNHRIFLCLFLRWRGIVGVGEASSKDPMVTSERLLADFISHRELSLKSRDLFACRMISRSCLVIGRYSVAKSSALFDLFECNLCRMSLDLFECN